MCNQSDQINQIYIQFSLCTMLSSLLIFNMKLLNHGVHHEIQDPRPSASHLATTGHFQKQYILRIKV